MKFSKRIGMAWMSLLGGLIASDAMAQLSMRNLRDFDYIQASEGWLTSYNAAGLFSLPLDNVSVVDASFQKNNGKFVNYYQSDDSFDCGLQTESYYKLSAKVALYGKVSYDFFQGRSMTGSVFVDPYYNLFDIVESDPERLGKKQKETYHLIGGVGVKLSDRWSIGGKIDYTTLNYAKMRDLRHINSLLDLTLTAGVRYRIGEKINLGASYFYRRSVESVRFQLSGETGKTYKSLISYGAFFGMEEAYNGESGYTSSSAQPMFNRFHGGSVQIEFALSPSTDWFHELTYKSRSGYYGERSSKTITFTEHTATVMEYRGQLSVRKTGALHTVKMAALYEDGVNDENIYKMSGGSSDGNSVVQYFGSNEVASRQRLNAEVVYTGYLGVRYFQPVWELSAGAVYRATDMQVSVYPYYRENSTSSAYGYLSAKRNIIGRKNMYSVRLDVGYGFGSGTRKNDGMYASSATPTTPDENDYYLNREFEYLTASRMTGGLGFRYSRFFKKGLTGYIEAESGLTHAFDVQDLGSNAFLCMIKVGCSF